MNAPFSNRMGLRLPQFEIGQVYETRVPDVTAWGDRDHWTVVGISEHPGKPVIAQHWSGMCRSYTREGRFLLSGATSDLDLVLLVSEPPDHCAVWG